MNEIVRFGLVPAGEPAEAIIAGTASKPGPHKYDTTLAFVEQAAKTIQALRRELDASHAQVLSLREELHHEQLARQTETHKIKGMVDTCDQLVQAAEKRTADAKLLASNAIARCEDMAAREASLTERANAFELRATTSEAWLHKIQQTVETEFSNLI